MCIPPDVLHQLYGFPSKSNQSTRSIREGDSLIFSASKKLILLNLKGCTSLSTLPGKIFMKSLKTRVLSGCWKLKEFLDIVGSSFGWN
ncbi:hypothetical protein CICLE_v10024621mg [Citrus x clementina]|uniref:Uncharacterized protein n=1 Tax=Citrus clementina TaxID=85681 RepID=V4TTA5_CITCL|nr:hypothetical protein CICLE_v10024621mg [Citrus x clementina]